MLDTPASHDSLNHNISELLKEEWYYRIQLRDDGWTNAQRFQSVGITRSLLNRVDLAFDGGVSLLDVGTMEAMIPIVAAARGAKNIVAYDRLSDRRKRVALIKQIYGHDFEHVTGLSLKEFRRDQVAQYDVVVFSGVLYHMFDPFAGLGLAASFARPGGIVILETAAISTDDCSLQFNKSGRFNPGTNYFMPSLDALDNFLRFFGLAAIDMQYVVHRLFPELLIRIALACRVVGDALPLSGDSWMKKDFALDLAEVNITRNASPKDMTDDIPYDAPSWSRATYREIPAINLSRALAMSKQWTTEEELTELSLKYRK